MRRLIAALVLCLWAGVASAACFPSFPSFARWQDGCTGSTTEWWNDSSLTFYAPFTDPANPLALTNGTGTLSFTRATTATYVSDNGYISTAASGTLRIEDNGALIEGQRTNLHPYSDEFNHAGGSANIGVTYSTGTGISPYGVGSDSFIIIEDTASTSHYARSNSYSATLTAGQTYTVSAFAKRGSGTRNVILGCTYGGTSFGVALNLSDGTIATGYGEVGTVAYGASQALSDGWYRISATGTMGGSLTTCLPYLTISNGTAYEHLGPAYAGDDTSSIYFTGTQVELGASSSSYIPTAAASVTRNLDQTSFPTASNLDNVAGTVAVQWTPLFANTVAASGNYYLFDAGSLEAYWNSTDDKIYLTDGTNTISTAALTFSANVAKDLAFTWGAAGLSITVDGTDTTGATYTAAVLGANTFIGADTTPANLLYANEKNFRVWNRKMTVSERGVIAP